MREKDPVEESIKTIYKKKIWSRFIRAINDFQMIDDGDRIAVGISGGKDSLLLAVLFKILQKDKSKHFDVKYISMDPGFSENDLKKFKEMLDKIHISCDFFDANVWKVAFEIAPDDPCFMCAKMRRGVLYNKAEELGCNKLALGHHFDDIVETVLINMFYAGTVKTMLPKVISTTGKMHIIRPLAYIYEKDIITYTKHNDITPMTCGCPVESGKIDSKRKEIKELLNKLEIDNKQIKKSIFNSLKNIELDYVMGYTGKHIKDGVKYGK